MSKNLPEVSVVVTVHDSEVYLPEALTSVLTQDFRDFAVIVVDDGSKTNACEKIVDQAREHSAQELRYIYQVNQGPSAARNRGLAESHAEFMAFLDGDDIYQPYKLSLQVELLKNLPRDYALVSGGSEQFPDGRPTEVKPFFPTLVDGNIYLGLVSEDVFLPESSGAHLFRRSALAAVGGFDETLWHREDLDLLIRLARHYRVKTHREVVFLRRVRPDSLSNNVDPEVFLKNSLYLVKKLEKFDPPLPQKVLRHRQQRIFFNTARILLWQHGDYDQFAKFMKEGVRQGGLPGTWRTWAGVLLAYSGIVGKLLCKGLFRQGLKNSHE